jgi:hypothetical protein
MEPIYPLVVGRLARHFTAMNLVIGVTKSRHETYGRQRERSGGVPERSLR